MADNRNPLRRYQLHLGDRSDDTILQPADKKVSAQHASEVCGQCHSISTRAKEDFFKPGTDLANAKKVIELHDPKSAAYIAEQSRRSSYYVENLFWPDGQTRVTGCEFNDLKTSPCYQGGAFTCFSCHRMHGADPNDQLAPRMETDEACFQCHQEFRGQVARHTRHAADSSGSRCYNCHMPHTTYGLMKAIRNHRVSSPSVANTLETGRPNACNLCHLDKTLGWTQEHLAKWFDQPKSELNDEQQSLSAAVVGLLRGDANQRALVAWALGWKPAREASGEWWIPPYIAEALKDRYPALRGVAGRSLRRLAGFADVEFDFEAPEFERLQVVERVMKAWREKQSSGSPRGETALLIKPDGSLDRAGMQRLLDQRDNRPVNLSE